MSKFNTVGTALSNMFYSKIEYMGYTFKTAESAFQAAKCKNIEDRKLFVELNGYKAKKLGQKIELRDDWERNKVKIMEEILRIKYKNPRMRVKLFETIRYEEIVEENTWGDTFWGVCDGYGDNHLGRTLLKIREEYRNEQ